MNTKQLLQLPQILFVLFFREIFIFTLILTKKLWRKLRLIAFDCDNREKGKGLDVIVTVVTTEDCTIWQIVPNTDKPEINEHVLIAACTEIDTAGGDHNNLNDFNFSFLSAQ